MKIRPVTVELLRAGPRHNQLLSPLTQYLGICGENEAGVIFIPYEHADFERDLAELSYEISSENPSERSSSLMRQLGRQMAGILGSIPGLGGALRDENEDDVLVSLRIVISASELALLPFELSTVPTSSAGEANRWLALQTKIPVCITRHIRSVSSDGVRWPTKLRVLFAVGPDVPPFDEHEEALTEAFRPWCNSDDLSEHLVTLKDATHEDLRDACSKAADEGTPFTHIHILAHGASLEDGDRYAPIGVQLLGQVVPGDQLAMSLTPMTRQGVHRPTVVTLATCDSAKKTDVKTQASSVAHELHESGIPLVVAFQFPLSMDGSIPFVRQFYRDQLWAHHPLESICDIRRQLYSHSGMALHDWSSLVVYEALPSDLDSKLEDLRYWQTRRAYNNALGQMESVSTDTVFFEKVRLVDDVVDKLPTSGPYAPECAGLRAAAWKRIGEAALKLAKRHIGSSEDRLLSECHSRLFKSLSEYESAAKLFLSSGTDTAYRKANLHWLLGQVLALEAFLGRPLKNEEWSAAKFAAEADLQSSDKGERTWANVSLAELYLLRLSNKELSPDDRKRNAEQAKHHISRMIDLVGYESEQTQSTYRQLQRYVDIWGNPEFEAAFKKLGLPPRDHWHEENGLVPTVQRLIDESGLAGFPHSGFASTSNNAEAPAKSECSPSKTIPAKTTSHAHRDGSFFTIEMLPALNGDCLWIEYGDDDTRHRILIDCGARTAAEMLKERLQQVTGNKQPAFELFVLTHIDSDHIDGVLCLFEEQTFAKEFKDIWFNGWKQLRSFLSVKQGEEFTKLLEDPARQLPWNHAMGGDQKSHPPAVVLTKEGSLPSISLFGGMKLTLLSPSVDQLKRMGKAWQKVLDELRPEEPMLGRKPRPAEIEDFDAFDLEELAKKTIPADRSPANGSSIAFLAEFGGRSALFTGDAHANVLVSSIKALQKQRGLSGQKLAVDAIKLSHHGSANATSCALLKIVACPRYLVSTNGSQFYHPDREAIARVILDGGNAPTLYFNYRSEFNLLWDNAKLREKYGYQADFPVEGEAGIRVEL